MARRCNNYQAIAEQVVPLGHITAFLKIVSPGLISGQKQVGLGAVFESEQTGAAQRFMGSSGSTAILGWDQIPPQPPNRISNAFFVFPDIRPDVKFYHED